MLDPAEVRALLDALLAQPHPEPAVLRVDISDRHAERRADPGEGIDHQPDQRAVAQTGMRCHHGIDPRCLYVGTMIPIPK